MNELAVQKLEKGDILMLDRGIYKHYGIYVGEKSVIHYTDKSGDWGMDVCIQKTSLENFSHGSEIIVCKFTNDFVERHTIYSPEETVARAYSRLGEREYNLVTNNCEHFVVWCKTGISDSEQVNAVLNTMAVFSFGFGIKKLIDAIDSEEISDIALSLIGLASATTMAYFGKSEQ